MKLSIITINFNNAEGLKKTIESVIDQTYSDFEYIIVDGGSQDGSVEIIKKYEKHIKYWISESDNGIYNAMNKGLKAAKGEYCQFLNSGDCLVQKDVTERIFSEADDSSILIGNMIKIFPNGKKILDKGLGNTKPSFFTFYKGTLNHSPAYIRRNLFEKYGDYDETLKIVSDWKWYLVAVGLNNESVSYFNIDVSLFEMSGISILEKKLLLQERRKVLESLVSLNILADYDKYSNGIIHLNRINTNYFTKKLFWFFDRILFQVEKLKRDWF